MYNLINDNIESILGTIRQNHVTEYDWLIQNAHLCATPNYRARFKYYWRLNAARLSASYCNAYFEILRATQVHPPSISNLAHQLYGTPTHVNGRQSLQFSLATKLVHMLAPTTPIYDSLVAAFYFFQEPRRRLPLAQRVSAFATFHTFLAQEYHRVLTNNLLAVSI